MTGDGHDLTPTGMIRRLSTEMMCDRIVQAWNMMSMKIIMKSFSNWDYKYS
jgi:hypothetical protein